jgi:hypothetical protein
MRYETLTWVNQQAEKARKEEEDKKLKNQIKKIVNKIIRKGVIK